MCSAFSSFTWLALASSLSLSLSLFSPLTSRSDLDWPVPKRRSRRGKRIFFRESRILLIFAKVGEKDKNKWVEVS